MKTIDLAEVKMYVGALSVRCGCPVCRECLTLREVLFIGGSEISPETALKMGYKCVYCSGLLAQPEITERNNV